MTHSADTSQLIQTLQARLLSLGRDLANPETELPPAEIERTAKAINQLIVSVEKSDAFLRAHGEGGARPGDYLHGARRDAFLRKIKVLVERGILEELDDA